MSRAHNKNMPSPLPPNLTEPFQNTRRNRSCVQEQADVDVHFDRNETENSDALRNPNSSTGISGNSSNALSVNPQQGANNADEFSEDDPSSTKDQLQTGSSENDSKELKDVTDRTKLGPQSGSPVDRSNKTRNKKREKLDKQKNRDKKDSDAPQLKVALPQKPKTTKADQSPRSSEEGEEVTDELSKTLKDEEDEYSDRSEEDPGTPPECESLLIDSNKTRYQKRKKLEHQTKKKSLPHKPKKTTDSKGRTSEEVEEETDERSETSKDEEDEYSDRSDDPGTRHQRTLLVEKSNKPKYQKQMSLDNQSKNQKIRGKTQHSRNDTTVGKGSIEEVEEGSNVPRETLQDEEDGAQKLQKESYKNPNEKQPANNKSTCQKCWKIWKIIICFFVILSAITGVVVSSLALSRKSITSIATEPTDGAWSHWGNWTECSVTCGKGIQHRSRNCSNPVPSQGGPYCAGHHLEYKMCRVQPCSATDGAWSHWGNWTECSVTCGKGIQHRSRNCSNPVPSQGGPYCAGHPLEYQMCRVQPCPATDGAWSHWGNWTECSVTCGKGIRHRNRNCSNPVPSQGGPYCAGHPLEYQMCRVQPCPVYRIVTQEEDIYVSHALYICSNGWGMEPMGKLDKPCPDSFPAFTVFHPKEIHFIRLASWDVLFQSGQDCNPSTGVFNCSVAGIYLFSVTLVKKHGPNTKVYCHIYKNDDHVNEDFIINTRNSTEMNAISLTAVLRLKKGDRVYLDDCTDPGLTLEKWIAFTGVLQSKE